MIPHGIDEDLEECRGRMTFPGTYGWFVVKPKFEINSLPAELCLSTPGLVPLWGRVVEGGGHRNFEFDRILTLI